MKYIDLRDYADYAKKHLRNFECIPYFALIFNEPIPVYAESDELLEALFPKNKVIFLMCQSGGRVNQLMKLLNARGWDMTKIYNIGGMAQYAGPEYRELTTDAPEILVNATYSFAGLPHQAVTAFPGKNERPRQVRGRSHFADVSLIPTSCTPSR